MSLDERLRLHQHSLSVSGKDDAGTLCRLVDHRYPFNIRLSKVDCRALRPALVRMGISHDLSAGLMLECGCRFLSHSSPLFVNLFRHALHGIGKDWQMRHDLLYQAL
jgi:hypothetical protein